jgi:hypothetical protein
MIERFNYEATNGGTTSAYIEKNGWLIFITPPNFQKEYAPAKEFCQIQIFFHPNGIIRERGKYLGSVKFGLWEYFDDKGNRTKVIDEDAKFGNVKTEDIIDFIKKKGIINRETGETIFYDQPLKTDGSLYMNTIGKLEIHISTKKDMYINKSIEIRDRLGMDNCEEKIIPIWEISYRFFIDKTTYFIDGNNINNYIKEEEKVYIEI